MNIKACIFDLDGVIVDTAKYHFTAWRQLANDLGFDFTKEDNEKLKGVSRMDSLDLILQWGGVDKNEEERLTLATKKNDNYLQYVNAMKPEEVLPGVEAFIKAIKADGIKIGLGSASKNAVAILERVGLIDLFETIIDGTKTTKGKPDPQVFQMGAANLGVKPNETIVFEDAEKGVQAALNGDFYAIGIGDAKTLGHAHYVMDDFEGVTLNGLIEKL